MCYAQDDSFRTESIVQHIVLNFLREAHNFPFNFII